MILYYSILLVLGYCLAWYQWPAFVGMAASVVCLLSLVATLGILLWLSREAE